MRKWSSVAEIAKEFGLDENPNDADAVRSGIRRLLAEQHPDRTGGAFSSVEREKRYHKLDDALDYLDSISKYLVPLDQIATLVRVVQDSLQPTQNNAAAARMEYREAARIDARNQLAIPRIGSAVFAAVCAALVAFSNSLKDNPVFGPLLQLPGSHQVLLGLFAYSGLLFVMTWLLEQRAKARAEWLASEAGLRSVLQRTIQGGRYQNDGTVRFTFDDICNAITQGHGYSRHRPSVSFAIAPFFFLQRRITDATAEKLARAHLEELERRGVAKKVDEGRLQITYSVKQDVLADV